MHAVADYTDEETTTCRKRYHMLRWIGALGMLGFIILDCMELENQFPYNAIGGFGRGLAIGVLICGILFTGKYGENARLQKESLCQTAWQGSNRSKKKKGRFSVLKIDLSF